MANKVYVTSEAAKTIKSAAGDATITASSLGAGSFRVSTQLDLGAAPRAGRYRLRVKCKPSAAATVNTEVAAIYLAQSSTTTAADIPGQPGTADATVTATKRYAMDQVMSVTSTDGSGATAEVQDELVFIDKRYVTLGFYATVASSVTAGDFEFELTPVPAEIQ